MSCSRSVPLFPCGGIQSSIWAPPFPPRYDLRGSPRADYRDLYRGMRRLATAQAKPRIFLFLSPLMIKARARGLRSTQRAIFFLFKTSPARLLDLVR